MPIVYSTAVKDARLQVVVDALGPSGTLTIGSSDLDGATGVLVQVPFNDPAFIVDDGAMEVNNLPLSVTAVGTGVADKVEFRHANGTVVASGLTIGLPESGADIILNALEISTGQNVQVTVGDITHG